MGKEGLVLYYVDHPKFALANAVLEGLVPANSEASEFNQKKEELSANDEVDRITGSTWPPINGLTPEENLTTDFYKKFPNS